MKRPEPGRTFPARSGKLQDFGRRAGRDRIFRPIGPSAEVLKAGLSAGQDFPRPIGPSAEVLKAGLSAGQDFPRPIGPSAEVLKAKLSAGQASHARSASR